MTIDFIVILVKIHIFSYFKKCTYMYIAFDDIQTLTITILQKKKKWKIDLFYERKLSKCTCLFTL